LGSDYGDTLIAARPYYELWGGAGDDVIQAGPPDGPPGDHMGRLRGEDGDDRLYGEAGEDYMGGGAGRDLLFGRNGADALIDDDGQDGDELYGNRGQDHLESGSGFDIDLLDGGKHEDECYFFFRVDSVVNCEVRVHA
jgi:Ca2+-binding RTX toxin-like protein